MTCSLSTSCFVAACNRKGHLDAARAADMTNAFKKTIALSAIEQLAINYIQASSSACVQRKILHQRSPPSKPASSQDILYRGVHVATRRKKGTDVLSRVGETHIL